MSARPRPSTSRNRGARLAAVQALYQIEMTGTPVAEVVEEFVGHRLGRSDESGTGSKSSAKRFGELVEGSMSRRDELDAAIRPLLAGGWKIERLEIVMRSILRLGAYELMAMYEVPARVVISEYVALAGAFYNGDEPGAVNGILDRLARSLRPGELEGKGNDVARSRQPPG